MPELPEVETIVKQLNKVLPGKVITEIKVLNEKSAGSDLGRLVGKRVRRVGRFAKYIQVDFEKSDEYLLVHLKMTGQLIFEESRNSRIQESRGRIVGGHPTKDWVSKLPSRHTRIMVMFGDESILYFNDQRIFGWMKTLVSNDLREMREAMPPDVIDKEFSLYYLGQVLRRSGRAVKLVILDQKKMGGMGNIYANDALWLARIHPGKKGHELRPTEVEKLHGAMVEVLRKGIKLGGASYSDFVDTRGMGGKYQEHFLVYGREGEKCRECGNEIEKVSLGGRGTYFCPECQSCR